jgi:hypothetical protein
MSEIKVDGFPRGCQSSGLPPETFVMDKLKIQSWDDAEKLPAADKVRFVQELLACYMGECKSLEAENEELKNWKQQMLAVAKPIFKFKHEEMRLGDDKFAFVVKLATERDQLRAEVERLKEVCATINRERNSFFDQSCKNRQERDQYLAMGEKLATGLDDLATHCEWYANNGLDQERHHFLAVDARGNFASILLDEWDELVKERE